MMKHTHLIGLLLACNREWLANTVYLLRAMLIACKCVYITRFLASKLLLETVIVDTGYLKTFELTEIY